MFKSDEVTSLFERSNGERSVLLITLQ